MPSAVRKSKATIVAASDGSTAPSPDRIAEAIRTLLAPLSTEEREKVLHALMPRPVAMPKAGEVLSFVARVFAEQKEATVSEVKEKLANAGVKAEPKEIYNAVGYLQRKRYVRQLSYGRYIIDGNYWESAEDLGGQPPIECD